MKARLLFCFVFFEEYITLWLCTLHFALMLWKRKCTQQAMTDSGHWVSVSVYHLVP